jgi:amidophosphoribosyltransferase
MNASLILEPSTQVPDTSRVAALNLAQKLKLPYREGFIKNRYVGRTFIMPGQQMRSVVRHKLDYSDLSPRASLGVRTFARS